MPKPCVIAALIHCCHSLPQIVDLETKEHLWYVDATNRGNWMRNIRCARYLEEQNILSTQEGTDIYYKAMKVRAQRVQS